MSSITYRPIDLVFMILLVRFSITAPTECYQCLTIHPYSQALRNSFHILRSNCQQRSKAQSRDCFLVMSWGEG